MSKLFKILDGIVDSSYDYTEQTLSSNAEVAAYAESTGEMISLDEASRVIAVGNKWLDDRENGNGEWSRMREEAKLALKD